MPIVCRSGLVRVSAATLGRLRDIAVPAAGPLLRHIAALARRGDVGIPAAGPLLRYETAALRSVAAALHLRISAGALCARTGPAAVHGRRAVQRRAVAGAVYAVVPRGLRLRAALSGTFRHAVGVGARKGRVRRIRGGAGSAEILREGRGLALRSLPGRVAAPGTAVGRIIALPAFGQIAALPAVGQITALPVVGQIAALRAVPLPAVRQVLPALLLGPAAAGEIPGVLRVFFLVCVDGLVPGDLVPDRPFAALLLLAGAELAPALGGALERARDGVREGLGRKAERAAGSPRRAQGQRARRADHLPGGGAHVARLDGLPARAVGQDAGQERCGLLGCLDAAVNQHELGEGVQHRLLEEHQLRRGNDGQIDQQQPHRYDRSEDAERLDKEGGGPLLELSAPVQRGGRDDRRRDDIEEEHVEDPGDAVQDHDHHVDDDGDGGEPDQDIVGLKADVEIGVDVAEAVNAPALFIVIGAAQSVVKGGRLVEAFVFRRPQGAHQEEHAVQVGARRDGVGRLHALPRGGLFRVAEILHRAGDAGGDALVVDVDHHVPGQVRAFGYSFQHRLPRLYDVPLVVRLVIGIVEHAPLLQKPEVAADGVEAGVEVVAVVAVGDHGIVAHRGQDAPHGGVFLFVELPDLLLVEMVGVVEDEIDLLHQDAGAAEDHVDDQRQSGDQDDAADAAPDDLAQGLLMPGAGVKHLADDRPAHEHEDQNDADDRHAPVNVVDRLVGKEDVDEEVLAPVVGGGGEPGEHVEEILEDADDPAQAALKVIADLEDRRIQDAFEDRTQGIAEKVLQSAPDISEHVFSLPFPRIIRQPRRPARTVHATFSCLRLTKTYTPTAARERKTSRKKTQLCRL